MTHKAPLDLSNASNDLWLVKVPNEFYDRLSQVSQGTRLGDLTIITTMNKNEKNEKKKNSSNIKISLDENIYKNEKKNENKNNNNNQNNNTTILPREFSLEFNKFIPIYLPFSSENEEIEIINKKTNYKKKEIRTKNSEIVGNITRNCTMRPILSKNYSKLMKNRIKKSYKKGKMKSINPNKILKHQEMNKFGNQSIVKLGIDPDIIVNKKRKAEELKLEKKSKIKLDPNTIRSHILRLFSQNNFLSLKAMNEELKQNDSVIKDVIREFTIYHKSGDFRGRYELKPEFKDSSDI